LPLPLEGRTALVQKTGRNLGVEEKGVKNKRGRRHSIVRGPGPPNRGTGNDARGDLGRVPSGDWQTRELTRNY